MSKRFENTIMGWRIGTLGVNVQLPCLVVYLWDNGIKICCKLSPLLKPENIHDWKAYFVFKETIEVMLNLCLTVYLSHT